MNWQNVTVKRFTPTCVGTTDAKPSPAGHWDGSPPHAWGQRSKRVSLSCSNTVHPHMRGDNCRPLLNREAAIGSPPHAWGQRLRLAFTTKRPIGSPPHAWGQRLIAGGIDEKPKVHPHMRGDNMAFAENWGMRIGSPPHAWGQLSRCANEGTGLRFTPTCVGTTEVDV